MLSRTLAVRVALHAMIPPSVAPMSKNLEHWRGGQRQHKVNQGELERDARETDLDDGSELEKAISRTAEENLAAKEEVHVKAEDGTDIIIVDWDSPEDPAFPKNWSNGRRMGATLV